MRPKIGLAIISVLCVGLPVLMAAQVKWTAKTQLAQMDNDDLFLVVDDANGTPASYKIPREEALISWAGSTNITTLGTIATGTWQGTDVGVAYGGTGVSTLDDGFVLLGNAAGAIQTLDVTTDGGIIIGDGTTDPVVLDVGSSSAITILGTVATGVWNAGAVTSSGAITATSGVDLGTSQALVGTTAMTIGNNAQTVAINSSDWDIDATGIATGMGNITSNGTIEGATLTEGGNAVPNSTDDLSFFAATTSAQLYGVLSDETGSGAGSPLAVFNQAPTIDSPTFTTAITATDLLTNAHFTHSTDWGDIETDGSGNVLIDADNNVTITGDWNFGGATNFELPNSATPTLPNLAGEVALDTNLLTGSTGQGILELHSGVQLTYLVATIDTPADNEIPKFDSTTGTIQWETDAGAAGGDNVYVDTVDVTDPDFQSGGDIDFVDTTNVITGNINTDVIDNTHFTHTTDWGDVEVDGSGNVLIDADNNVTITGDWNFGGATNFELPNSATPTLPNLAGEVALDTNLLTGATGQGVLELHSGVQLTYIVATIDTPADNEIPKFDSTAGTIQWEADTGGGDSIQIDSVDVVDPDFQSTADIDFIDTTNVVTANINDNAVDIGTIKDVDASVDEDILTRETTTGDFEWHTIQQMLDIPFTTNGLLERTGVATYGIATEGTDYYGPAGTDIPVTDGGTGRSTSTTAYGLIAAGTTATGAHQTLAAGLTTQILVGGGAAALPSWGTDIPTAVTIGSAYIYRASGTDVPVGDGGLGTDVSAYTDGLVGVATGAVTDIDTEAELETALGSIDVVVVATDDISSANLATALSDEDGTGLVVFDTSSTLTTPTIAGATLTGNIDAGGGDLELPQATPGAPDADGEVELDFTDGTVVVQHGSAHAELGASTDIVVGKLIKSFSATLAMPDLLQAEIDQWPLKSIETTEFPHGIVVTDIYLKTSASSTYAVNVENWDDPTTINASNPTIDAITTSTSTEATEDTITYSTIAGGQIIMLDLPTTDIGWVYISVEWYEPIA